MMKTEIITLTGELHLIERLNNSINGNPRYMLRIDDTVFYTKPDCSYGYSITNYTNFNKVVTVELKYYYGKLSLDRILK